MDQFLWAVSLEEATCTVLSALLVSLPNNTNLTQPSHGFNKPASPAPVSPEASDLCQTAPAEQQRCQQCDKHHCDRWSRLTGGKWHGDPALREALQQQATRLHVPSPCWVQTLLALYMRCSITCSSISPFLPCPSTAAISPSRHQPCHAGLSSHTFHSSSQQPALHLSSWMASHHPFKVIAGLGIKFNEMAMTCMVPAVLPSPINSLLHPFLSFCFTYYSMPNKLSVML